MTLRNLVFITIVICVFTIGCEPEKTANKGFDISEAVFEVVSTEPENPAALESGQKFNVNIIYKLNSTDKAVVWARPYYKGKKASGYNAHHLIPIGNDDKKEGLVTGWFYFKNAAQVDEVKVFVKDMKADKMPDEISYPVNLKWKAPQGNETNRVKNTCGSR